MHTDFPGDRSSGLVFHVFKNFKFVVIHTDKSFNKMWTINFQMFNLVLEKAEEPEIKLPTSAGSS